MKTILEFLTITIVAALFAMPQTRIPSAATDPAAITSAVEQSAADVSSESHVSPDAPGAVLADSFVSSGEAPYTPAQPAPVYRVARPAPIRQYSSCGTGGCGGRWRIFGGRR
jgi:hypothetical protein